ncbi:MAG: thiamine-monophosphate kinase, partial [Fibrobacter sp.]|nr:thiamine-monophosphate kinase [Fibrobacter sp.]
MSVQNYPSSEYELIHTLQGVLGFQDNPAYDVAIGDDAAIRQCQGAEKLVLTTDISVENVHFSLKTASLREIGYKAMVTNLSDCAAMGALPDSALVALTFPASLKDLKSAIAEIYSGFAEACDRWKFPVVGGDLSSGNQWVISITLIGKSLPGSRILRRTGAKDGDLLWVSGFPGRSGAGLAALQKYGRIKEPEVYNT